MANEKQPAKEKEFILSDKIILDYFYNDDKKIAVLDNKAFKNIPKDDLILVEMVDGETEVMLEALTDEDYKNAVKKYSDLLKLINEGGEDE